MVSVAKFGHFQLTLDPESGIVFGRLDSRESPQKTINLLFLLNVSCFWFGCNNAAKELVKERVIFTRERDFNLRLDSYCLSKFLVLVLIAMIQVALLFGIVRLWCQPPGSAAWQWATLASLATAGTALGLLISAFARTEEVAVAFVPIAVIPQIILGGVIAPLSGLAKIVAKSAITVHWAEQALEALLPASQGESQYGGPLTVVWAHACAFLMATFLILWSPGIAKGQR